MKMDFIVAQDKLTKNTTYSLLQSNCSDEFFFHHLFQT
jgi:hypothetical protein